MRSGARRLYRALASPDADAPLFLTKSGNQFSCHPVRQSGANSFGSRSLYLIGARPAAWGRRCLPCGKLPQGFEPVVRSLLDAIVS
jgi:hypothetical protein